jgi:hypothetical protein
MSPKKSFLYDRIFKYGTSTYEYISINCIQLYICALYIVIIKGIINCINLSVSVVIGFIRYSFRCFEEWYCFDLLNSFHFGYPLVCMPALPCRTFRVLTTPGMPPLRYLLSIHTRRIVPSLIRLVGDPFGKEAGRETNIGDTKHVNKHINQHGRLTGWFVPRTK